MVVNCTTHAQFNLHYSTIHKIVKRKGYLILYTGANQVVTIKPTTLEKNPSLLPYLLQKCPRRQAAGVLMRKTKAFFSVSRETVNQ